MTRVARSSALLWLPMLFVACADGPPRSAESYVDDADGSVGSDVLADAGVDATSEADAGTDASAPIIVIPLLVDFCGDGIDQDGDGTADDDCNRVFVAETNLSLKAIAESGHLLDAADGICAAAALQAGLAGTFVAYLSTPTTSARSRLGSARGFVRVDGKPIADTATDFANGQLRYPVLLAANGLTGASRALTVSTSQGLYDSLDNCAGMTDFVNGKVASGTTNAGGGSFEADGTGGCGGSSAAFYCVGTDFETPLASPSIAPNAHRAFVSQAGFGSGGGLAAADALCASEASAAGLAGPFVAFLPTTSATAASRITNDGAPVVRVDGVVVALTTQAFFARIWRAPLAATAKGTSFAGAEGMWTAAPSPLDVTDGNCANYTTASAAASTTGVLTNQAWGAVPANSFSCAIGVGHIMCVRP